ncbi:MAG: SMI1/KNR4 family protein [Phascolarctobacterium sp.]|nr:SMI1/KNR4 family protein [Phascolarctobacterium sp.]
MNQELRIAIKRHESIGDFTYPIVEDKLISEAEHKLCLVLPISYIEFLKEFGHGGLDGIETFGIGKNNQLIFVDETLKYRNLGLPHNFIVIENCDEWLYCLDSNNGQIITWTYNETPEFSFNSFDEYLQCRINDAIDNM